MALIDLEGRWLRMNRSIAQMLGRTEQDLRAMRLADLSHPDDERLDRPLIKELLAGRRRSYALSAGSCTPTATSSTRSCTCR
jgi:PAS domain S-box-containing protein